jgi:hypothetical protein
MALALPLDHDRLDRQLMRRKAHRFVRGCPVDAFHLE